MIIVRFAELDDFLEEVGEYARHLEHPIRISSFDAPGPPGTDPVWFTKAGVPIGDQLFELTLFGAGEATAEQHVKKLQEKLDAFNVDVRTGSQYSAA